MSKPTKTYKMSFSTGGLFVNESVAVARLHAAGSDWKQTILIAMGDGATSLPKSASNRRTLREIVNRLSCLTDEERQFLVDDADRPEQEALLWLATCRAYRFVGEFAVEVIQDLSHVTGYASKAAEQACRIADVLTLWRDLYARDVTGADMADAITLAQFYLSEAARLSDGAKVSAEIERAEALRKWLVDRWPEPDIMLRDVMHDCPTRALRESPKARAAINLLVQHGWLVLMPPGTVVRGKPRKEAWRIVRPGNVA